MRRLLILAAVALMTVGCAQPGSSHDADARSSSTPAPTEAQRVAAAAGCPSTLGRWEGEGSTAAAIDSNTCVIAGVTVRFVEVNDPSIALPMALLDIGDGDRYVASWRGRYAITSSDAPTIARVQALFDSW